MEDRPQNVSHHLGELRIRFLTSIFCIAVFSIGSYFFRDALLRIATKPAGSDIKFIFTSPTEAFYVTLELAIFSGFILALPIIFFNLWRFCSCALTKKERRISFAYFLAAIVLFGLGGTFTYFVFLPIGLRFLIAFGSPTILPFISISSYISFVITLIIASGIMFELPIAISLLVKIGILEESTLRKNRRLAILVIFVLAAVISPNDGLTQILFAIPLIALFELGLFLARFKGS